MIFKGRIYKNYQKDLEKLNDIESDSDYSRRLIKEISVSKQKITKITFESCLFYKCDLNESTISNCLFEKCLLVDCTFNIAKLPGTRLIDTTFLRCKLTGIEWAQLNVKMGLKLHCLRCDLSYGIFDHVDISSSKMTRCKMFEVILNEVKARKCNFRRSDFLRTSFQRSLFIESDFRKAKSYLINPQENICTHAKFTYPEVMGLLEHLKIVVEDA